MKIRLVYAFACTLLVLGFVSAKAQTTSPAAAPADTVQSTAAPATVYVYRYKQFVGSALAPSVFCDENELARIENGRFFAVTLPAGKHVFRANDKQSGIDVDLTPGQKYYIRAEIATGFMKGHGRLTTVTAEQGSYEIKNLKPLDSDKVKDSQHVTLTIASSN